MASSEECEVTLSQLVTNNLQQTNKLHEIWPKQSKDLPGVNVEEIDDWEEFSRVLVGQSSFFMGNFESYMAEVGLAQDLNEKCMCI